MKPWTQCIHNSCTSCLGTTLKVNKTFKLQACGTVEYKRGREYLIGLTINGYRTYYHQMRLINRTNVCTPVPGLGKDKSLCFQIYNVRGRRMCTRLLGNALINGKHVNGSIEYGCFRIPCLDQGMSGDNCDVPVDNDEDDAVTEEWREPTDKDGMDNDFVIDE
ncbi:hypothetical protein MAR_021926 [Mya arenaria]|uniref:DUF4773 domain-containing protein n=2 Tax=Mya arenaria TaxID=6604 RepID=A0ABY7EC77_MYAAR|nr:hypothetical protein MAR_021926 [Mya arenaria]